MARQEQPTAGSLVWRATRIVVPWVVLIVVVTVVWSTLAEYRQALRGTTEATATVEPTSAVGIPSGDGPYVRVLSQDLNLRSEPSTAAAVLGVLALDQQLTLLDEGAGWYRVRTADGLEGWVAAGGAYTELVQP
jgi:SH3-like domain-containing protein